MEYTLAHVGINTNSPEEAADLANLLCTMTPDRREAVEEPFCLSQKGCAS